MAEALGLSAASVFIGLYLASGSDHTVTQIVMLSFPPASLWMAVRHQPHRAGHRKPQPAAPERMTSAAATVNRVLDLDDLVRAS